MIERDIIYLNTKIGDHMNYHDTKDVVVFFDGSYKLFSIFVYFKLYDGSAPS
jgi:hypothetical protein